MINEHLLKNEYFTLVIGWMIFPFSDFALETQESRDPINVLITDSNDIIDYIIIIKVDRLSIVSLV